MTTNPYLRSDLTVLVPGPVAAWLCREAGLAECRGVHPVLDAVVAAFEDVHNELRRRNGGTAAGTRSVARPEREPESNVQVGTAAAADIIGISRRGVRKAAEAGRLEGELIDGHWRLVLASVHAYRDNRTP